MADITAIRKGLEVRLQTISTLTSTSHTIPEQILTPMAYVSIPTERGSILGMYDQSYGDGTSTWAFVIKLLLGKWDDGIAQDALDPFIGDDPSNTQSIVRAILGDPKLGGACSDVMVKHVASYGGHRVNEITYAGCDFLVHVICSQ